MNAFTVLKKKMKNKAVVVASAAGAVALTATSALAAIDLTSVSTDIGNAVTDLVAGGVILLGAYAGFWGIKKLMALFAHN